MAKENTNQVDEVEETEETEEAVEGMRPNQLAKELGIDAKRLRGWLRATFPRDDSDKNKSWSLNEEQIDAAYGRFSKDEEPEGDDTDSDEEEA